ncbi:MAG: hypothetical protein VXZ72_05215, partial [Chlamydiota bacterium]|nr:hypothetical protein [Chlamydiota bacterium]
MKTKNFWRPALVALVALLTIYHILPTLLYYRHDLEKPLSVSQGEEVGKRAWERIYHLSEKSDQWITSFCQLIGVDPIESQKDEDCGVIKLNFSSEADARRFSLLLPQAGEMIPNPSERLSLFPAEGMQDSKTVFVKRSLMPLNNQPPLYHTVIPNDLQSTGRDWLSTQLSSLLFYMGKTSSQAILLEDLTTNSQTDEDSLILFKLSDYVDHIIALFGEQSSISQTFFAQLTQSFSLKKDQQIDNLLDKLLAEKERLEREGEENSVKGAMIKNMLKLVRRYPKGFAGGKEPWLIGQCQEMAASPPDSGEIQELLLEGRFPGFSKCIVDWERAQVTLTLDPQVEELIQDMRVKEWLDREISRLNRTTHFDFIKTPQGFRSSLRGSRGDQPLLIMETQEMGRQLAHAYGNMVKRYWQASHPDFHSDHFLISTHENLDTLNNSPFGLVIVPGCEAQSLIRSPRPDTLYVILKGIIPLLQQHERERGSEHSRHFFREWKALQSLLVAQKFVPSSSSMLSIADRERDILLALPHYLLPYLRATEESFELDGLARFATLALGDQRNRLLVENRIADQEHTYLLQWSEAYEKRVAIGKTNLLVPKPNRSPILSNFALSWTKYFRGDEKKTLQWGLDLSGGKNIHVAIENHLGEVLSDNEDLKQASDELFKRINHMGLSEVAIRQEGDYLSLDFPHAQGMEAGDLIQASLMSFHVVNEAFSPYHPEWGESVKAFLDDVWSEASLTQQMTPEGCQKIAWKHLYGGSLDSPLPLTIPAKTLYEKGLRLSRPGDVATSSFDDQLSKVAIQQQEDVVGMNPLMFILSHYALQGSDLQDVQVSRDPHRGNVLTFAVKEKSQQREGDNPASTFYEWTHYFSREGVRHTSL